MFSYCSISRVKFRTYSPFLEANKFKFQHEYHDIQWFIYVIIVFLFLLNQLTCLPAFDFYHIFFQLTCHSGAKKKHRKEMIAVKRRERMLRRGVDLEDINSVNFLCMHSYVHFWLKWQQTALPLVISSSVQC